MNIKRAIEVGKVLERLESAEKVYEKASAIRDSVDSGDFNIVHVNKNKLLVLTNVAGVEFKIPARMITELLSSVQDGLYERKEKILEELDKL